MKEVWLFERFCVPLRQILKIMAKVRITAVRQTVYSDLMKMYEKPIPHACNIHEGQQWISVMTTVKEQRISHLAEVFGLNHELLSTMMSMRVTEQNIDEFGRFTNLQNTINIEKAQAYFRDSKGENMTIFEAHVKAGELLRKFILRNGFDI